MFGDLLKKLAMNKIGDISEDKLGFDASSLFGGLFGGGFGKGDGSIFQDFLGDNPDLKPLGDLQSLFGDKMQDEENQFDIKGILEKYL